ncbi:MAG: hypothetical protein DRQ02_11740, partial [Candidatus Latescibacterota bacterium]
IGQIAQDTDWTYLHGSWTAAGNEDRIQIQLPCATNFVAQSKFQPKFLEKKNLTTKSGFVKLKNGNPERPSILNQQVVLWLKLEGSKQK